MNQFKESPLDKRVAVAQHKRKRFMIISPAQEILLGRQFVSPMESPDNLWHKQSAENRCNNILKRLLVVMPEGFTPPDRIYILDTPIVNACCLPDGSIVVSRGLLKHFTMMNWHG